MCCVRIGIVCEESSVDDYYCAIFDRIWGVLRLSCNQNEGNVVI